MTQIPQLSLGFFSGVHHLSMDVVVYITSQMNTANIFDTTKQDPLTGRPTRTRSNHSSYESEMAYKSMLPIAKQLKAESGTRFSVRYLVQHYKTPQAIQQKLTWVRGCKASVG